LDFTVAGRYVGGRLNEGDTMADTFLTLRQLCDEYPLSPSLATRLIRDGKFCPAIPLTENKKIYSRATFEAWLLSLTESPKVSAPPTPEDPPRRRRGRPRKGERLAGTQM
jgi:hypothetical protein